jgi:DUF1365 family protein
VNELKSAIYTGRVRHVRRSPAEHMFSVPLYLLYLDLAEIDRVFDGTSFWSATRPALGRFRRGDFHGDPNRPLDEAVRDLVAQRTGSRPRGDIRLLANVQTFGVAFNPAAFYYCFDEAGELEHVVTEITNTPWKERHTYVVGRGGEPGTPAATFDKAFHVSPFMDMDLTYRWRFTTPDRTLNVRMENLADGERFFAATLSMERRALTPRALDRLLVRYPFMSAQVIAGIHFHALRLWMKRCPFYPHPAKRSIPNQKVVR